MSRNNTNNSQNSRSSSRGLQSLIEDLKKKRDDLNLKTKKYISELQEIETEIDTHLKNAKEKYKKKRDYWNKTNELYGKHKDDFEQEGNLTLYEGLYQETEQLIEVYKEERGSRHLYFVTP